MKKLLIITIIALTVGFAIPVYAINCYMEEHDANWCEVHQCDKSDCINDECHNHNEHHH